MKQQKTIKDHHNQNNAKNFTKIANQCKTQFSSRGFRRRLRSSICTQELKKTLHQVQRHANETFCPEVQPSPQSSSENQFFQLFLCHCRVHPPPESKNHSGKGQNLYQRATLLLAVCQSHVIQKRLRMLGTHKNSPLVGLVVHPVCHILMSAVKQLRLGGC